MAYEFLGPLRSPARTAVLHLLKLAFDTHDGRELLVNTVRGYLGDRNRFGHVSRFLGEAPYGAIRSGSVPAQSKPAALFLTARFRSGSTLLWNIFRQIDGCTAYYEPLNERRWFDSTARGDHVDRTHLGVTDYWREYAGLDALGDVYEQHWTNRHLYMPSTWWEPKLRAYIQALIDHAPERAVLQFNRVDFRLAWLRSTFPEARIIHLYRNPRDQWCSSLVDVKNFPASGRLADFEPYDHFYLLSWARDLRNVFPFLAGRADDHPYRVFYFIWRLSYLFGRCHSDASFCYEHLVQNPTAELRRLLDCSRIDFADIEPLQRIIVGDATSKWPQYAEAGWFERLEADCERTLCEFFGRGSPAD